MKELEKSKKVLEKPKKLVYNRRKESQRGHIRRDMPFSFMREGASMSTLETNDLKILNDIIYKIYATKNLDTMRASLLRQLRMIMDYDGADFFLAPKEPYGSYEAPVLYNCEEGAVVDYMEKEYEENPFLNGKSMVYRDTDLVPERERVHSEYYQHICKPNNWNYSIQLVLGMNRDVLGVATFYRTMGKDDFKRDDMMILDMLKDHLSYRLYQEKMEQETGEKKLGISEAAQEYHLTKREKTILQHLMAGKENDCICEELSISVNTLKKHILNIYRKLGIRNRVQLFKMIRERE